MVWDKGGFYMANIKKIVIIAIIVIVLCAGTYGIKYLADVRKYKEIINGISINNVDLSSVNDGSYTGDFDAIFIEAKVNVKVQNHRIVGIKLIKHKNERGKRAEIIPQKVVESQSLNVDTVSGATNSSKVILKAIENALKSGENNL